VLHLSFLRERALDRPQGGNPAAPATNPQLETATMTTDDPTTTRPTGECHPACKLLPQPNGELRNGYADDPSELGRRVREARIARNWTQGELAEAAGTHGPIISQIENGKLGKVGKATLQRVAAAVL
jgi:DNA-binding XRE family transcriptional regulator